MDLISREAAIRELVLAGTKEPNVERGLLILSGIAVAIDIIEKVPAAQPEKRTNKRTKTHACDCISRAAAIEHLKKRLYETEFNSTAEYPYYQEIADNRVDVWMNEVPSAQPERKTGRWIKEHIDVTDKEHPKSFRFHRCSVCGHVAAPALFVDEEKWLRYCPHCGAYMGGAEE